MFCIKDRPVTSRQQSFMARLLTQVTQQRMTRGKAATQCYPPPFFPLLSFPSQ